MEFILTYKTEDWPGYRVMTIQGANLTSAMFDYEGYQEDIISIVRVWY